MGTVLKILAGPNSLAQIVKQYSPSPEIPRSATSSKLMLGLFISGVCIVLIIIVVVIRRLKKRRYYRFRS